MFDPDLIVQSPLVVLHGYNHGVFSSGELPGAMQMLDIDSDLYIDDGHAVITNFTMMFIANTLQLHESPLDKIRKAFRKEFNKTGELMKVEYYKVTVCNGLYILLIWYISKITIRSPCEGRWERGGNLK